jgi:hypothetical protein
MKAHNLYVPIVLVLLGIFVLSYSYRIGIGSIDNPGSGLFPFLLGLLLFLLSLYKIKLETRKKIGEKIGHPPLFFKKLVALISSLFFYALFLHTLGYLLTTLITLSFIFRIAGYKRWSKIVIYAMGIVLISYFIFTYLGVRFPQGPLSRWI